ncbi:CBS domain-containing protein [Bacillus salacetis]|uniref:CBS domain-containing protein n=1 Tax=Bacillus salacetis TaxID=2315464 RepID=UPI003B9F958A
METTTTAILSERFEAAFNQIHEQLKKLVSARTDRFTSLVRFGMRHKAVETFEDELIQFAKLRNAIVHEKISPGYYIAEPHQEVVERIEKIAGILLKPNYAMSIATKNVIWFDGEDSLEGVIHEMKQCTYSQFPVYKDGLCVGLLTTRGIVNWMAEHIAGSVVNLHNFQVKDILDYEKTRPISHVPKSINIFEVEEIFEEHHQKKLELEAVIITENGLPHETPLGIVTAWDLIEIDYTVD